MSSPQIFVFLVADLFLNGLLSNGFIVTVIIREWTKRRRLASSEQLLLSLALSNICTTVLSAPFFCARFLMDKVLYNSVFIKLFSSTVFLMMIRFWFTAWLCVFYCIKIVNNTHSLFLWCKMRISWLIIQLLIGSLVFSCFASFFLLEVFPNEHENNKAANVTNVTQLKTLKDSLGSFHFYFFVVGSSCPLFVVLFCSITVVASLCRHIYRMARNTSSFKDLQTKAHIKAAGVVLSLLFLYVSFFVAKILSISAELQDKVLLFVSVVMIMYGPAQATILIFSNPKLKQAFSQLLHREKSLEGKAKCALEIP